MSAVAAARQILNQLHEVMASRLHPQGKLDRVVEVIGEALDSEVCSIYLLREGMLELFATRGLEQSAVHVTRLAVGEGLNGIIAEHVETLNLAEAASHPDFAYRPETGEEKFHSFAGVPIVHRERAVGTLCVQHADPRRYEEIEIEALQTVAMVLSDPELRAQWERELTAMRLRIREMRTLLHAKLEVLAPGGGHDFVTAQRGMFSYTGLTKPQVDRLRNEFAIYAVDSGRICVAALNLRNLDHVASAIATVSKS